MKRFWAEQYSFPIIAGDEQNGGLAIAGACIYVGGPEVNESRDDQQHGHIAFFFLSSSSKAVGRYITHS